MFPSALLVVSRTTKSWGKEILARMLICTTLYLYRPLLLHHAYYALILTWFYSDYDQIPRNVGEGDRSSQGFSSEPQTIFLLRLCLEGAGEFSNRRKDKIASKIHPHKKELKFTNGQSEMGSESL
jgi:hypothetical protein